jgi:hypothetical protein
MITLDGFFNGREKKYARELTDDIRNNASLTVKLINELLKLADGDGIPCCVCSSGWRPLAVNDVTSNAAKGSKHISGLAADILDYPQRDFARWCLRNLAQLERIGLWMEDPRWTPTWVHLQIVPPGSGRRVYIPSVKPPLAAPLPEQRDRA